MKILLLSSSTVYGKPYLEYCNFLLDDLFDGVDELLFIPYAQPGGISMEDYTDIARKRFAKMEMKTTGIHRLDNNKSAFDKFKAVFIGGGNTFLLLKMLYQYDLIETLKTKVKKGSLRYLGTSAGSNVAGLNIKTTNDMPITYPPTFEGLGFINANINPHYLDPQPNTNHMGETRETRIKEFLALPENTETVIGLREGSGLKIYDGKITLVGDYAARVFQKGKPPREMSKIEDFSFLLK